MNSTGKIGLLLPQIYPALEAVSGDYCIIGSAALLLSGIQLPVHDLDILTSLAGAERLKATWRRWKDESYKPQEPERFRSNFGRFNFEELPVEVMGDLEVCRNGIWEKVLAKDIRTVFVDGKLVSLPGLLEQKRILLQLGRAKDLQKAAMIEKFLAQ